MFMGVELGIACTLGLSIVLIIIRASFPEVVTLGKLPGTSLFRNVNHYPDSSQDPSVYVVRVNAPLFFANAENVKQHILDHIRVSREEGIAVMNVIVDLGPVSDVDSTATSVLRSLIVELKVEGATLLVANPSERVVVIFRRVKLLEDLGEHSVLVSINACYVEAKRRQAAINKAAENGEQFSGEHSRHDADPDPDDKTEKGSAPHSDVELQPVEPAVPIASPSHAVGGEKEDPLLRREGEVMTEVPSRKSTAPEVPRTEMAPSGTLGNFCDSGCSSRLDVAGCDGDESHALHSGQRDEAL